MCQFIKDCIFAWRYKRAVRKAKKLASLFGMKYYVVAINGKIKVAPKQAFKELIRTRRFRKGVTIQDIERRALFIAMPHNS